MDKAIYKVGGCVRDEMLGITSKDIDYVAVGFKSLAELRVFLVERDFIIYTQEDKYKMIRCQHPSTRKPIEVVLSRKEGSYTDGRHPNFVAPGTLQEDLQRRDFTINAMAMTDRGVLIDLFGGQKDLQNKILRCVGNSDDRFAEDWLRILRAARFTIKYGLQPTPEIEQVFEGNKSTLLKKLSLLNINRRREELLKMYSFNTEKTYSFFAKYPSFFIASHKGLFLKPSNSFCKGKVKFSD